MCMGNAVGGEGWEDDDGMADKDKVAKNIKENLSTVLLWIESNCVTMIGRFNHSGKETIQTLFCEIEG